jgi:hypothetical protein
MNSYNKLLEYFPPVENSIKDLYEETRYQYAVYSSTLPLKKISLDLKYNPDILKTLQEIREYLNITLTDEQIEYELTRLLNNWGKSGLNILIFEVRDLIEKVLIKINHRREIIKELVDEYRDNQADKDLNKLIKNISTKRIIDTEDSSIDTLIDKINIFTFKQSLLPEKSSSSNQASSRKQSLIKKIAQNKKKSNTSIVKGISKH